MCRRKLWEKRGVTFRSQSTGGTTLEEIGNTAKEARKSAALDGQQGRVVTMFISETDYLEAVYQVLRLPMGLMELSAYGAVVLWKNIII